ncbi:hypothetical protein L226DRAFT_539135 [Lentinus tigrinus ALCF2SS1-7]|uniref:Uncharacterized protein n=1 Tax=Lentinus tigrinus ALCF2SS1-6 TaxID=1328759 RepID=A0A5C2RU15_9APHY|nr:hypothetical protein L227DRAFT_310975 [Lentinus tigrinus ALCF2SS1-6]RPD70101.1 hypothetical protein L226DRAFT_539135 [Lentinus tigrinus ALCF2SS1-7]
MNRSVPGHCPSWLHKVNFKGLGQSLRRGIKRPTTRTGTALTKLKQNIDEPDIELELTRRQLQETQQTIESLQRRLNGTVEKREYDRVVAKRRNLEALLEVRSKELQEAQTELESTRRQIQEAQQTVESLQGPLPVSGTVEKEEYDRVVAKLRDLEAVLEVRSKELQEAQTYVAKLDEVADSEVVNIVEPLNGLIFQAAASLSDAPEFWHSDDPFQDAAAISEAKTRLAASSWVGSDLLDIITDWRHEEHPVYVQLALQAGLAAYTRQFSNRWEPTNAEDTTTIEKLYEAIRDQEPQSVAGRWRALGRTHLKSLLPGQDYVPSLISKLSGIVTDILLVAGATGTKDVIAGIVSTEFESDLREIVTFALRFHSTVGERVVSRDFSLLAAEPGDPFDTTRMEVEYPLAPTLQGARVLGTTQLGLVAQRSVERDGVHGEFETRRVVLLKCSVILQDAVELDQDHFAN